MFIAKTAKTVTEGFNLDKDKLKTLFMLLASLMVNEQIGFLMSTNRAKTSIKVTLYDDRLSDATRTQWINDNDELDAFIDGFALHYNLRPFNVKLLPYGNAQNNPE
jgi:hypothetical protein